MAKSRLYSLFARVDGRWLRLSATALRLDPARRVFQTALLGGSVRGYEMALRPAVEDFDNRDVYRQNFDRMFNVGGAA